MYAVAVADAGGLLSASGIVEGLRHEVVEYVALDATTLLVAEFLAVLHAGAPTRASADYADLLRIVGEWFPIRSLAMDAVLRTPSAASSDSWAALALAEAMAVPIVTKNDELRSRAVPVLRA